MCICKCICKCICICACVCMYMHVYVYVNFSTYTICEYVHNMYVCVYVYSYWDALLAFVAALRASGPLFAPQAQRRDELQRYMRMCLLVC